MTSTGFTEKQLNALQSALDPRLIKRRDDSSQIYIEGYVAINQANTIFGFDAWEYELVGTPKPITTGNGKIVYFARVRVTVTFPDGRTISREDVGAQSVASGAGKDTPEAHDTAIKGSVTDALKRALRSFGDQFGNSLYDKDDEVNKALKAGASPSGVQKAAVGRAQKKAANEGDLDSRPCEGDGGEKGCPNLVTTYHSDRLNRTISVREQLELGRRFEKALCRDCLAKAYEASKVKAN